MKRLVKKFKKLKPTTKITIYTIVDLVLSWILPAIIVATQYKLFEAGAEPQTKATAITYILLITFVGAIFWRAKEIVALTRSNGIKYALTKGLTPFLFLLFYIVLGHAEANIDKLRVIFLWSGITHFIALYFRFKVGQLTKVISNKEIVDQIKAAVKKP
jgi:hypothetical protein